MLRFAVLTILFAVVCAAPINDKSNSTELDVIVVDSIDEYLKQNPEVELFEPFEKEIIQVRDVPGDLRQVHKIQYTIGKRVSGDHQVATTTYASQWSSSYNRSATLKYPKDGSESGALVSFVRVIVHQTSRDGRMHITSGGIGQRRFTAVVEAKRSSQLRYNAYIMGTN